MALAPSFPILIFCPRVARMELGDYSNTGWIEENQGKIIYDRDSFEVQI